MEEFMIARGFNNNVPEFEEKVEVLELRDIEKELCLVQSWIRLMPHDKTFMTPLSPEETVALLVRYSMYDSVVQLCDLFNLNKSILFENVALACCKVPLEREDATEIGPRNPEWILVNTEFVNQVPKAAWFYLRHLLMQTEKTKYFRTCARVFLFSACALPAWFVIEYQKRNAAELLAIYVAYERLAEATELAIAMVRYGESCLYGEYFKQRLQRLINCDKSITGERDARFELRRAQHPRYSKVREKCLAASQRHRLSAV